jgi:hypothetical protein
MDPFAHADEAHSRSELGDLKLEAKAVIAYFQAEIAVRTSQPDRDALRGGVLRGIIPDFLQDFKKARMAGDGWPARSI